MPLELIVLNNSPNPPSGQMKKWNKRWAIIDKNKDVTKLKLTTEVKTLRK